MMWEMQHRPRGFRITKCYSSVWCAACPGILPVVSGIHRPCAVGVSPVRVVLWCLGSALRWVSVSSVSFVYISLPDAVLKATEALLLGSWTACNPRRVQLALFLQLLVLFSAVTTVTAS